jgi:hypothetical protein
MPIIGTVFFRAMEYRITIAIVSVAFRLGVLPKAPKKSQRKGYKFAACFPDSGGILASLTDVLKGTSINWAEGIEASGRFFVSFSGEFSGRKTEAKKLESKLGDILQTKAGVGVLWMSLNAGLLITGFGTSNVCESANMESDLLEITMNSVHGTNESPSDRWTFFKPLVTGRFPEIEAPYIAVNHEQCWRVSYRQVAKFHEKELIRKPLDFNEATDSVRFVTNLPKQSAPKPESACQLTINLFSEDRDGLLNDLASIFAPNDLEVASFQCGVTGSHTKPLFGIDVQLIAPAIPRPQLARFVGRLENNLQARGFDVVCRPGWHISERGFSRPQE